MRQAKQNAKATAIREAYEAEVEARENKLAAERLQLQLAAEEEAHRLREQGVLYVSPPEPTSELVAAAIHSTLPLLASACICSAVQRVGPVTLSDCRVRCSHSRAGASECLGNAAAGLCIVAPLMRRGV
jgi:hypothetical protein